MTTHETTPAKSPEQAGATGAAYAKDGVAYLNRLRQLFEAYKRRTFKFLDLRPGLRVLDIGCGTGDDIRIMSQLVGPTGRAVGIDNNPAMIEEAVRRATPGAANEKYIHGDVFRMPFEEASFDRCYADRVFQHLPHPAKALAELVRVTDKGGWVVVIDADWETLVIDAADRSVTRRVLNYRCDQQAGSWAGRQLYGLFKTAGLKEIETVSDSVTVNELKVADYMWGLEEFASRAQQAGVISADEKDRWLADLRERDAAGTFFASATGFGVRGRRT